MKFVKYTLLFTAITCLTISCKKNMEDDTGDCSDNNTMKVTYTNTGTVPLRVMVATSLTPQFVPVNPIHSIDLAPGASVVKEFEADQYFNVWYKDCATTCTRSTYNSRTYASCSENEEKFGL